jgi:DNA-binding beta-propeller fold protein YncE
MSMDSGSGGNTAVLDEPVPPAPEPETTDNRRRKLIILGIIGALILIIGSLFAWYLITRKPITALPGISAEAMPHYRYSIYGIQAPLGVAASPEGDKIYVTQSAGKRTVLEFDHAGKLLATLAPPASTGAAHVPVYVALNPTNGDVYVTDRMTAAIYVYTSDGTYLRTFKPTNLTGAWAPLGIAFDKQGNVYVSEVGGKSHRILGIDPTGKVFRTLIATDQDLSFPNGIAVDDKGTVLVSDSNNGRLLAFDKDGKVFATVNRGIGNGDLGLPRGVATDDSARVFVVDATNQTVHIYRLGDEGTNKVAFVGAFGDEGIADGLFEYPNGVATDNRSDIYVTDRENGRLQVWSF